MSRKHLLLALPLLATLLAPQPARAAAQRYVALGDSYVAGALIGHPVGSPALCLRTDGNYPHRLARALGIGDLADASCSSAETIHLTQPQPMPGGLGQAPPQFDALDEATTLVTIGIGANDIKLLDVISTCATLSALDALGSPCTKHFTSGGVDQLQQRIDAMAPKIGAALQEIHARAPGARVLVVGYLTVFPPRYGCWPAVPVAVGDIPYLYGKQAAMNDLLAAQAAANGAGFVDVDAARRDVCQMPWRRWVEPVVPVSPATPFHPNGAGMQAVTDRILAGLAA
ncbi:SGNH/GDSL hydrolase family protein [Nonomuraea sp. NPDC050556]|uniref:SGNH/GDSL hydrolase family protein n=1 Tax=Nonomuraea sp. NPDC050556 TaxID=3364369 RepID=UPI0037929D57